MPVISRATCATEKSYTSLESPNIQLFGGLKTYCVAFITKQPGLLEWNSYEFIKMGVGALIEEPRPISLDLQKAEY